MKFSIYQTSHQGSRQNNEDRMGYSHSSEAVLLVLADGMGGHPEGQKAAQIAIETVANFFLKEATPKIADVALFLESALLTAHREILRYAIDKGMPDSPRTTLVAAVAQEGKLQWIHCGDSRLYFMRDESILKRTRDHSYSELRDSVINNSTNIINRNVLFTCLGSPARPIYDTSEIIDLCIDDRILLCSDGLWGALDDVSILQGIGKTGNLKEQSHELVQLALHKAGKTSDNITLVAMEWKDVFTPKAPHIENYDSHFLDEEGLVTTISGALFNDDDIERSLGEINSTLEKYRKQ